jgi:hypothetical protein
MLMFYWIRNIVEIFALPMLNNECGLHSPMRPKMSVLPLTYNFNTRLDNDLC